MESDKLQFKLLGRRRKAKVREIARWAFRRSPHDQDMAVELAEKNIRLTTTGFWEVLLIKIAIQLAIMLIQWWREKAIADPGEVPMLGEPGSE